MKSDLRLMSDACEMAGLAEEFDALVKERDALEDALTKYAEFDRYGNPINDAAFALCPDFVKATRKEEEDATR